MEFIKILFYTISLILWGLLVFPPPILPKGKPNESKFISIIIPARNEEKNLPTIIQSILKQKYKNYEVIVVDDFSSDKTVEVAEKLGAKVVKMSKLDGCFGKPCACFKGYKESSGELLLFLDADVVLREDALERLLKAYETYGAVVSVWPYHRIKYFFENASMLFNIIGAVSLGNSSILSRLLKPDGLFGPCILIDRSTYESIGGHSGVINEVLEDFALGKKLKEKNFKIKNFWGYDTISFRMYSNFNEIIQGWSKNFSKGAISINPIKFIVIFLYITALFSISFHFKDYFIFYLIFAIELFLTSRLIGNFNFLFSLVIPIPLILFFAIFIYSAFLTFFKRKVFWKGREINI